MSQTTEVENSLQGIWTQAGHERVAAWLAGGEQVTFTTGAVGDGNGVIPKPSASQTALVNQVWSGPVNDVQVNPDDPTEVWVDVVIPLNAGGFWVREWGLYDEQGKLIAVGPHEEMRKPAMSSGQAAEYQERFCLPVSDAAAISLTISPKALITEERAERKIADHNAGSSSHPDLRQEIGEMGNGMGSLASDLANHAAAGMSQVHGGVEAIPLAPGSGLVVAEVPEQEGEGEDSIPAHKALGLDPSAWTEPVVIEVQKRIRVERWLAGDRAWRVAPDGDDSKAGLDEYPDMPFATIQAAVNHVSSNYNFDTYKATIQIDTGTYAPFTIPKYSATTGQLYIAGAGKSSTVIEATDVTGVSAVASAGRVILSDFRVNLRAVATDRARFLSAFSTPTGVIFNISNCAINIYEGAATTSYLYGFVGNNGLIEIDGGNSVTANGRSSGSNITVLLPQSTRIHLNGNGTVLTINGTGYMCCFANAMGTFARQGGNAVSPVIAGAFNGYRCSAAGLSLVSTLGAGQAFFPGTTNGWIEDGSKLT